MEQKFLRTNLSGIYIFEKFPGEERREPTCIEDCTDETRNKWLETLEKEALIRTVNILCGTLHRAGAILISSGIIEEEQDD